MEAREPLSPPMLHLDAGSSPSASAAASWSHAAAAELVNWCHLVARQPAVTRYLNTAVVLAVR
jgi:hypothetical protein